LENNHLPFVSTSYRERPLEFMLQEEDSFDARKKFVLSSPAMLRPIRRIAWGLFLLIWVGAAVLWVRSYWRTDDIFLIYRGEGSEHLRIRRGMLALIHTDPTPPKKRQGIERFSVATVRDDSQRGGVVMPQNYPTHKQWLGFSLDSLSSRQITNMQSAQTAQAISTGNQAALVALQAFLAAQANYYQARDAAAEAPDDPKLTLNLINAQKAMLAANRQVLVIQAQQVQVPAAPLPLPTAQWQLIFPVWSLLVLASIPLALLLAMALAQRRRKQRGLCAICAYDLRGNTSGVCPECGTQIVRNSSNQNSAL